LSQATIKAVQEALNKQGIAVLTDGVMNDETRNAIRKYQSQHHLPVTGDADKATLDKLGVVGQLGTPPSSTTTVGQGSTTSSAEHDHSHGAGGTTSGPMMHGMMQGMMQAMHGMMGMMRGQMQPDQKQSGSMPGGRMMAQQGGPMNCPMMSESNQTSGPQMMQMMQGMMQMMETMQKQMQSQQKP
jgi:peptidoglycan hydrolase-like protein with peptidoglycan-binding domain